MKIRINEDMSRKIATKENNIHVQRGFNEHKHTNIAPSELMMPLSPEIKVNIELQYKKLENLLYNTIGRPFYSHSGFILYCGDCCRFMEQLQQTGFKVDLTVTSPPYNIGKEYEERIPVESYVQWCAKWMSLIHKITADEGTFWLNLGYSDVPKKGLCVPIPYLLWDKSPFYLLQEIVWKYGAGVATKHYLSPRNEKWLFYVKHPSRYTFNLDNIRDPNVKYPNQKKNGKYRCNPFGKNPSDVWEFPKVTTGVSRSSKERTKHPAQFPLAVVERIGLHPYD
jgi:adenine-specific DNA-methyltransferase